MLCILFVMFVNGNVQAATVRALDVPDGYTISPEGERRQITVAHDETVFAIASEIDERSGLRPIAIRWHNSDTAQTFEPLDLFGQPGQNRLRGPAPNAIVASSFDTAFVNVGQVSDGAVLRMFYKVQRWTANATVAWKNPPCADSRFTGVHILGVDDRGQIALTFDPSYGAAGIDLENPASIRDNLPTAVAVRGQQCTVLGNAILMAIDGNYAAGYIGYLDGKPMPWAINAMDEQMVASRWSSTKEIALGNGVPYAISHTGLTVGATALPGHAKEFAYNGSGRHGFPTPHAIAWLPNGKSIRPVKDDERSVAWDVSEDGTIVGIEQLKTGKHYAFRWKNGRAQRLDDLPHPPGWRFESAYAIRPDGSIIGIGTHNGVATAFIWRE